MANYTLTTVADAVKRLGQRTDGQNTNVFWTEEEKLFALNEALRVWQCLTGQWGMQMILTIPSGVVFHSVPRQFASLLRVTRSLGQVALPDAPLQLISLEELNTGFPDWQSTTGTPLYWAPAGVNSFALYPYPSAETRLNLFGYIDLLTVGLGDYINIGNEELTRVLDYGRHYLSFKEGMSSLQASSEALTRLAEAASFKNARIENTEMFKKWMGLEHDEHVGRESVGVRG